MRFHSSLIAAALLAVATSAGAQSTNPVADALRAAVKRGERNMVAAAQDMPADKYGYKPTPAQMTFGQIVLHVAGSNELLCANLTGQARPQREKLTATSSKEDLVEAIKHSFDFCNSSLANLTDANLSQVIPLYSTYTATRAAEMMELAADLSDHYAAMAGYLRLNDILPPTARPKK